MAPHLNHLAGQKSPYLLQHVENPVDWYPWTEEAFYKSHQEQKPIMLSIGYSTCHWCHVMAHESFESEETAKIINENFVAIKVDREERPDLDQIYMTAVSAMTGQGGWPLTVFLTPEGKPFYGGTYFPPVAKWGNPSFNDLLRTIIRAWKEQREQLLSSSHEITQLLIEQTQRFVLSAEVPGVSLLETASRQISTQYDPQNGGFGSAPKFPMGHYISFLLRFYQRSKNQKYLEMVEDTLTAIARGGIYDHLGGGFHRYSTDAHWHIPHFEKMLYDQALLTKAYLEGYQLTGNLKYAATAGETLDYVLKDMQHPLGGFYCAEDADSLTDSGHKAEGAFYVWPQQDIINILGEQQALIFNYAFGVRSEGNAQSDPHGEFIGNNILYLAHSMEETASYFKLDAKQVKEILRTAKLKLLEVRSKRPRPHLDDKILVDWNGLMIGALSWAGIILNEPRYLTAAKKAADFILAHLKSNHRLLHCWRQESSPILGTLEDYAFFINGLLDLYETSSEEKYFAEAKQLANDMINLFEDKEQGGFFLTGHDASALIIRPKDIYDGAMPSGNSMAAYLLMRLYSITSEEKWFNHVENLFKTFSASIEKSPSAYTFALCAFDFYFGPSLSIVLEGNKEDPFLSEMKKVVYKHFIPNKSLFFRPSGSLARAYICRGNVCQSPVHEIHELEQQLLS